jgi:diamine N-acetyltransferase
MMQHAPVTLRHATLADRRAVYEWLACSDLTASMAGPPEFDEAPVPTWDEFCDDYVPCFFDGSQPHVGRSFIIEHEGKAVGHVSYSRMDEFPGAGAELDIWMRNASCCGKGYGSAALDMLARQLHQQFGVNELILRPSARNARAIASYKKAGFTRLDFTPQQQGERYGPGEYHDTVTMQRLFE